MDAATETIVYERTLSIEASPETVWEFFVDPEKLMRWKGINADLDAEPGGNFRCEVIPGHIARGEYVELDAPNRLVFTWGWDGSEGVPRARRRSRSSSRRPATERASASCTGPLERRGSRLAFTRLGPLPPAPRDRAAGGDPGGTPGSLNAPSM